MNIFVTDSSPIVSAKNLDDKRLVKMVLETAQMLSTSMHVCGAPNPPYKITHKNHPCSVWARSTKSNYQWLLDHFVALCDEYTHRYKKTHKCASLLSKFVNAKQFIPDGDLQPHANCSRLKDIETRLAYRLTMISKWAEDEENKRKPKWTNSFPPEWLLV